MLSAERESYYCNEMLKLAGRFEASCRHFYTSPNNPLRDMSPAQIAEMDPEAIRVSLLSHDPDLVRLDKEYHAASDVLYRELEAEGEEIEWNKLAEISGMQARVEACMQQTGNENGPR